MISRVMLGCLLCLVCGFSGAVHANIKELIGPRSFTDVFGRIVTGEIVALSADTIGLRRYPDGAEFSLPLDRLSDADRTFLEDNREKIVEWVTPLAETEFTASLRKDFRVLKRSGQALEPVPARMWAKSKYFLIIYGLHDSSDPADMGLKYFGDDFAKKIKGTSVAVLWLGPSNRNGHKPPPIPESDLKLAKVLPAGVAVIGAEAVVRDGAAVDAEIETIAGEESPENPNLFFQGVGRRPEEVRAVWRKRVLARVPAYWPGCVYREVFDKKIRIGVSTPAFIVDREGKPALDKEGRPLEGGMFEVMTAVETLTRAER
jgi:hypothetical protein